jgi:DNA topoisomerase-1
VALSLHRLRPVKVRRKIVLPLDPHESASFAGLRYVTSTGPAILRKRAGRGFVFIGVDGKPIRAKDQIQRIKSLAIPPAWTSVWICPNPYGHLQAVGRDARGRKQYRYHPVYRQVRNHTKFSRMVAFATALPHIRQRVLKDLELPGLPREKVIATVVRLLETTYIRVGNEEYAKSNSSFGLTTMRDKHVQISGHTLRFHFRGKSGLEHNVAMTDARLARIVKRCQDLPGYELFQYVDENGDACKIDSHDVNEYLREISGQDFTAKDFRTWSGTVLTAVTLAEIGECKSDSQAKKNIVAAIKQTSQRLGNRPATCRNYYVHPALVDAYMDGELVRAMAQPPEKPSTESAGGLRPEEVCVMQLIQRHERKELEKIAEVKASFAGESNGAGGLHRKAS